MGIILSHLPVAPSLAAQALGVYRPASAIPLPPLSGAQAELRDRLGRHVAVLAGGIGERNLWRHEALEASAGYVKQAFRAAGYEVTSQHYTAQGKTVRNRRSCRVCIDCCDGGGHR